MKGFMKKGAVIIAAGMLLTGCGEELTTLTESEEAVIVNYSAGTLAKFNKRQQDGLTVVAPKEEEAEQEESVVPQEEEVKENQQNQQNQDKTDDVQETVEQEEAETEVSLTQALAIPGVEVKYTGYEIRNSYEESTALSMVADEGNTYFVMKYTLTNTGSEEAVCEILKKQPVFTLSLNGSAAHKNAVTLLSNDLATYSENLAPGATAEAVLVFEVPLEETTEISSVEADVQVNGVKGNATK